MLLVVQEEKIVQCGFYVHSANISRNILRYFLAIEIILISLVATAGDLISQDVNFSFSQLSAKDGLNVGYNDFIYKDSRGFVWISSFQGLFRFDGVEVEKIQHSTHGILDDNIQSSFFEDTKGNIWFSTVTGINCYLRSKNEFKTHKIVREGTKDTIDAGYYLIHVEGDSLLWASAGKDIYLYNLKERKASFITSASGVRFAVEKERAGGKLKHIYACPWEDGAGLLKIAIEKDQFVQIDTLLNDGFVKVNGALFDDVKGLWLFSDDGLLHYDTTYSRNFESYPSPKGIPNVVFEGELRGDSLYVGLRNGGLGVFDLQIKKYVDVIVSEPNDPSSLSENDLKKVYIDQEDNIWVSNWTKAGVDFSWIHANRFRVPPGGQGNVTSILEDGSGNVWSATTNNGVTVFFAGSSTYQTFPYQSNSGPKGFNAITQLSLSPTGEVWALNDHYIFRYHPRKQRFEQVYNGESLNLSCLIHLSVTAKLLSTNYGIYEITFDPATGKTDRERSDIVDANTLVLYFFQDKSGNLYLPNQANRLQFYRKKSDFIYENHSVEIPGFVYTIEEEPDTNLIWIGTSEGLYKLDLSSLMSYPEFTEERDKPFMQVLDIARDDDGYLWFCTTNGLWRYDPKDEKTLIQFRREDGLPSIDFSFFSSVSAQNGKIWLGSSKGPIVFNPRQTKPNPFPPRVQLKSIYINQQDSGKWLPNFIGESKQIELEYWQNNLEFDAVAINSYQPQLNKITYRLTNYDGRWQTEENGSKIRFIDLRPGDYTLELKGIGVNGIEGPVRSLSIVIVPAFWQIGWVQSLFLVILVISVVWLYRYLLRRKVRLKTQEIERREKALQVERDRIAVEMHDDLGGDLTAINLLIKKTLKEPVTENAKRYLSTIERYATDSIESMSEIIWAMNSSYDNLDQLIAYTRRYIAEMLDEHEVDYKAMVQREIPALRISGKKRRNIFLTLKEALHNIIRHSNASLVTLQISIDQEQKVLYIVLKDDGIGLGKNGNRFGNGLRNMRLRIQEIEGQIILESQNGTSIKLEIPIHE